MLFHVYMENKTDFSTALAVRMEDLTAFAAQQKSECVTWFHQTGSITQTPQKYSTTFTDSQSDRNSTVYWAQNFEKHGKVWNAKAPGGPGASSNQVLIVRNDFVRRPSKSLRRAEQNFNISWSSIYDIVRNRMHMFPYKTRALEHLKDHDYTACIEFAQWCLLNI